MIYEYIDFVKTNGYFEQMCIRDRDTAMPKRSIYGGSYGYYDDEDEATESMTLLTDRSLYRPGQTVYVKGIAYMQKSDTANVLPGKDYTVTLLDTNNQESGA